MSFARPVAGLAPSLFLLGLGAATLLFDPLGAASVLRGKLFDAWQARAQALPMQNGDAQGPVGLVTLDAGSLAHYGRWPWPDSGLSELTGAMRAAGASLVVFTAPLDRPEGDDVPAPLGAMTAVAPVLLGVGGLPPHPATRFDYRGGRAPFAAVPEFSIGAGPQQAVARAAAGLGANNLTPDRDGVVRRMPLLFTLDGKPLPSLSAEAARLAAGETHITLDTDANDPFSLHWGVAGVAALESGGHTIPTDGDGRFWMDYAALPQAISASALLSHELPPGALQDRVLVLDTPEDIVATPRGPMSRGAVTALAIQNLITGRVLARPSFALPCELWGLILAACAAMLLMARQRGHWAALFCAGVLALSFCGSWFAFTGPHWLIDAATPGLFLSLIFAAAALMRWREIAAARAGLRLAFSDSLPRASVERIAHRPQLLSIEGETRAVTCLVCGVRGLAGLAAALRDDPKSFTRIMQQVLTPLMDQALAHGGTIDRLTADGFAAFWNAPLDDAEHALHACEAANGMSVMASRIGEQIALMRGGTGALEIGVGVATGPAIAGGFGGAGRLGYSVHGHVVELAGRIQALSPQYGPAVIVAETTQAEASRGFAFLEVDYIASGRDDQPVRLYAILGSPVTRASPKFRALIAFHEHIFASLRRQQWGKARELITQCRKLSGASQTLYDLHLKRIGYFEANPPGPEWDGAFRPVLK